MNAQQIVEVDGEFTVVFSTGWTTQCRTREEGQQLLDEEAPVKVAYAGGTRYHRPVKILRRSDNLVKVACGQRGWISENPAGLMPCGRCY